MTDVDERRRFQQHLLSELGFVVRPAEGGVEGSARVIPEMHAPGAETLRTSVLAIWADIMSGLLAAHDLGGRVPVTLELDIHLLRPAPSAGTVRGRGRALKKGRTVFVAGVDFSDEEGDVFGFGSASFMAAPDPAMRLPEQMGWELPAPEQTLSVPLARRAGCELRSPGVVVLACADDRLNSSRTLNGGLITLAAEEAALSHSPGRSLCLLDVRYLQPVRIGPAVATASTTEGLSRVEVRDAGRHDRLAAMATTRTFGA